MGTNQVLKRNIIVTADGSKTIQIEEWNERYHSRHGAVQESYHVFIDNGLRLFRDTKISILEIGFGTGLNALITLIESEKLNLDINYVGVEAFPVSGKEVEELNHVSRLDAKDYQRSYTKMHCSPWEKENPIQKNFNLTKQKKDFRAVNDINLFNLIYFDAFGARVQPKLWTAEIFQIMFKALRKNGILVTYSAKGSVRRALQEVGFKVERLSGPPGKREMLRACKL